MADLTARERQAKALELASLGWSYTDIAKELDYHDHSGVGKAIEAAYIRQTKPATEIVRRMEVDRLDMMLRKALEIMNSVHVFVQQGHVVRRRVVDEMGNFNVLGVDDEGEPIYEMVDIIDHGPSLAAIQTALKIMDRRAKLLGLDAPSKVEVLTIDLLDQKIRELAEELGENPEALIGGAET